MGSPFNKVQKYLQILCKNCAHVIGLALSDQLILLPCLNTRNLLYFCHLAILNHPISAQKKIQLLHSLGGPSSLFTYGSFMDFLGSFFMFLTKQENTHTCTRARTHTHTHHLIYLQTGLGWTCSLIGFQDSSEIVQVNSGFWEE